MRPEAETGAVAARVLSGATGTPVVRCRGRALAFRLAGGAPPGRGEDDGRGRRGLVRARGRGRELLPPPREEGRPRHVRRPAGRLLPAGDRREPDGVAPLHRPEHLPARAEALLEGPRLRGLAGGGAVQVPRRRHRSPSGSSTRTESRSRRARSRRTPSAPRPASSSSRRGASSAAGGSRARSRAARRCGSRSTSGRRSRSTFQEPKEPMRLNRKAVLTGEAKYYFGLPVASGNVTWRVTRETVRPWWWSFWGWGSPAKAQTVASGATVLGADGTFLGLLHARGRRDRREGERPDVALRRERRRRRRRGRDARARPARCASGSSPSRRASASRRASQREKEPASATITRSSLDGAPRAGKGSWRLVALVPSGDDARSRPTCPAAARPPKERRTLPRARRTRRPETPCVPAGRPRFNVGGRPP